MMRKAVLIALISVAGSNLAMAYPDADVDAASMDSSDSQVSEAHHLEMKELVQILPAAQLEQMNRQPAVLGPATDSPVGDNEAYFLHDETTTGPIEIDPVIQN